MNITDVLGYIDSLKRQYGGTLADIAADPRKGLLGVSDRLNQGAREWNRDMMGQMGGLLSVRPEVQEQSMEGLLGTLPMPAGINAIRAYHGSPHKFDKFDLSKIGTGEGAQAYGWGGYVAEATPTAEGYRERLSKVALDGGDDSIPRFIRYGDTRPRRVDMSVPSNKLSPGDTALTYLNINHGSSMGAADDLRGMISEGVPDADRYKKALKILESGKLKRAKLREESGYLYELDLRWPDAAREAADPMGPQHFLDWDKPLAEQSEAVQKALLKLGASKTDTGAQAYTYLDTKAPGLGAQDKFGQPIKRAENYASSLIGKEGIPGIRYLDAGSRGPAGNGRWKLTFKDGRTETFNFKPNDDVLDMMGAKAEPIGTANYVVFDDAIIELLKRNGIDIPKGK